LRKGIETTTIFCQDYRRDASRKPTKEFDSKGENIVEYKLGRITRG
jgi:hypothetical protein